MGIQDVEIWFARNKNGDIVTIDEVDKEKDKENQEEYHCPICNSILRTKTGVERAWHFAHVDRSKCNNESIYHFWYKNKLLQQGDKFIIRSDSDKEYICKEILVEQTYNVGDKIYKPDLTVICENDNIIYFEFDYTNKKKLQDYIDLWIGLGNTVVEIDVKTLLNYKKDKLPVFKALWYEGKCFNVKKGEQIYYNTIGKYKENLINNKNYTKRKEEIKKLDWFWKDVIKYKQKKINIQQMVNTIDCINCEEERNVLNEILGKRSCNDLYNDYLKYKSNNILKYLKNNIKELETKKYKIELSDLYKNYYNKILTQDVCFYNFIEDSVCSYNILNYSNNLILDHIIGNIEKIERQEKYDLNLEYAKNNINIKDAIIDIKEKYIKMDDRYNIYDRFGYGLYITFCYNSHQLVDFDISNREDIIYSSNKEYIKNEIQKEIDLFFKDFNLFDNISIVENILDKLNKKFNNIEIKEYRTIKNKISKRRYYYKNVEDTYMYGIEYESKSEGMIKLKIVKYDKNLTYRYSKSLSEKSHLYFYIFNDSIYSTLNEPSNGISYNMFHKEYKKYLSLIYSFKSNEDLENKLINIISNEIRKDRYKI